VRIGEGRSVAPLKIKLDSRQSMVRKKRNNVDQLLTTQVRLDAKTDTPFYYVNYMSVTFASYDFTISVARLPSALSLEQQVDIQKGKTLTFEPTLQLVVPPCVIRGLIDALTEQVAKYESQFGKIITERQGNDKNK